MGAITDFVNEQFGPIHTETQDTLAKLDALVPAIEALPEDQLAITLAGILQKTTEKKQGAQAMKIVKAVTPVLLNLLAMA